MLLLSDFITTKRDSKDSSPFILLLTKFLIPKWVMRGKRFLPKHIYSSASFHHLWWIHNQDYSCTYPPGIEHEGTVEKGRDSDRELDQGQPEARATPEKVEKEVKKIRWKSHPEKFGARALDGHHRDYIILLFVGFARKSTFVRWVSSKEYPCLFFFFF